MASAPRRLWSWLKILTQDIDTTTPYGRLIFTILAAVAELERETTRERVRAGMQLARERGKAVGRPARRPVEEHRRWPEVRDLVLAGTLTRAEGARRLQVRYTEFTTALRKGGPSQAPSSEFTEGSLRRPAQRTSFRKGSRFVRG